MRSTLPLAALCTAAVLALTACGGDDKDDAKDGAKDAAGKSAPRASHGAEDAGVAKLSGPEILNKAIEATKSAGSLKVDMDAVSDGTRVRYHMASDSKGECTGTMGIGDAGTMRLIRTGATAYVKYDAAFWKSQGADGEAAAEAIGDRWTKTAASSPDAKDLTAACDTKELLAELETGPTLVEKGEITTVDGRKVITLTERDGKETTTVHVAAEGKPYLLKVATTGGDEPGTMAFSDFGKPVKATAPTGDIVDLDAL